MKRKFLWFMPALLFFLLLPLWTALAGDIPESLLTGDQQAIVIGQIVSHEGGTYQIRPDTLLMGQVEGEQIDTLIASYYGSSVTPRQGHWVVLVIRQDGTVDQDWLFQCSSGEEETLELLSEKYSMVERYERYINEGLYRRVAVVETAVTLPPSNAPAGPTDARATATAVVAVTKSVPTILLLSVVLGILTLMGMGGIALLLFLLLRKKKG